MTITLPMDGERLCISPLITQSNASLVGLFMIQTMLHYFT